MKPSSKDGRMGDGSEESQSEMQAENGLNASLHVVRHSDFRVLVLKSFENFQQ